jgi:hypothetical protein
VSGDVASNHSSDKIQRQKYKQADAGNGNLGETSKQEIYEQLNKHTLYTQQNAQQCYAQ